MRLAVGVLWFCFSASVTQALAEPFPSRAHEPGLPPRERETLRDDLDQYSNEIYGREQLERRRQFLRERARKRFNEADRSGNGLLDREEFERQYPNAAQHFDWIDANGDGEISPVELARALRARMELRRPYAERRFFRPQGQGAAPNQAK